MSGEGAWRARHRDGHVLEADELEGRGDAARRGCVKGKGEGRAADGAALAVVDDNVGRGARAGRGGGPLTCHEGRAGAACHAVAKKGRAARDAGPAVVALSAVPLAHPHVNPPIVLVHHPPVQPLVPDAHSSISTQPPPPSALKPAAHAHARPADPVLLVFAGHTEQVALPSSALKLDGPHLEQAGPPKPGAHSEHADTAVAANEEVTFVPKPA